MSGELAHRALGKLDGSKKARDLRFDDLGRLVGIETGAAVYVGELAAIMMFASGSFYLNVKRGVYEAKAQIDADTTVWFGISDPAEREDDRG